MLRAGLPAMFGTALLTAIESIDVIAEESSDKAPEGRMLDALFRKPATEPKEHGPDVVCRSAFLESWLCVVVNVTCRRLCTSVYVLTSPFS